MDVICIFNGLGNQMSQYAFYYAKKKNNPYGTCFITDKHKDNMAHNGYELDRIFGIKTNIIKDKVLHHIRNSQFTPVFGYKLLERIAYDIKESPDYSYNKYITNPSKHHGFTFYWGGWHSEKYFRHLRKDILQVFKFDHSILNKETKIWDTEIENDTFSCSLHIRRGDFLKDKKWADAIKPGYYMKAIDYIQSKYPQTTFYVFSNDIDWCRKEFGQNTFKYIDCNKGIDSWQDMYLMSRCHNHINANSSFSWWGAWLCTYPDSITIVPRAFISTMDTPDIYPEEWVKI